MQIFNDQTLMCYKTVKKLPGVNEAFRQTINSWMIDYYRNHYELDDFWHEYPFVDTERLSSEDAKNLIEILIDSSMYSQAYELVCIYGCSRVAVTKLLKMTDYILKNVSDSHNDVIDEINITNDSLDIDEKVLIDQINKVISLYPEQDKMKMLDRLLETESYLSVTAKKQMIISRLGLENE